MSTPIVSVLIEPCHHERFLEEAVSSFLARDLPASDWEILVVDDGSTDRTPEILGKFEPQARVLRQSDGGRASAFHDGTPECRDEMIAFLDGVDWWAPNKLTSLVAAFAAPPAVGLIGHRISEVLADGTPRSELVRDDPHFRIDWAAGAKLFCLRKSFLGTNRMAQFPGAKLARSLR